MLLWRRAQGQAGAASSGGHQPGWMGSNTTQQKAQATNLRRQFGIPLHTPELIVYDEFKPDPAPVARSGCQCRQADIEIIAERGDGFQRHVAGALNGLLVILLQQDRADQSSDRGFVRKNADHVDAPLDLAVQSLDRISGMDLGAVLGWKVREGQHIGLRVVHQGCQFRYARPRLVGDLAPLLACGGGIVLSKGGADPGRSNSSSSIALRHRKRSWLVRRSATSSPAAI